ncbi:MAG: hypothetical protein GY820_08150, partial [Gammaproteobacteria bacterium]|nr:hypothetical protein [Gammaproteobacteria bacterium]
MTEEEIEQLAIERFQPLGYAYFHGPDIAPNSDNPQRSSFDHVLLTETLR